MSLSVISAVLLLVTVISIGTWFVGKPSTPKAPTPAARPMPTQPPKQPEDLFPEDADWYWGQMERAGFTRPPRPKVSLVKPYRKPHGWEYVEERAICDRQPTYIPTRRIT